MRIKRTLFSTHAMIRNALLALPLLFIILLFYLQEGIGIETLKIGHYRIEGLYIKLDKKLILKARKIVIPRTHEAAPLRIDRSLHRLRRLLSFFQSVELGDLIYTNDHYRFFYADRVLYIRSDTYEFAGRIHPAKGRIGIGVSLFYLPRLDLRLHGMLEYRPRSDGIEAAGAFDMAGIHGSFSAQKRGDRLRYRIASEASSSLKPLLERIGASRTLTRWLTERIKASRYRVLYLEGGGMLKEGGFLQDFDSLKGWGILEEPVIRFRDTLPPVRARRARLHLNGSQLQIDFEDPRYAGRSIAGSRVALYGIAQPRGLRLRLHLRYRGPLDRTMLSIAESYGVRLPLAQIRGRGALRLDLELPLAQTRSLRLKGAVRLGAGSLMLGGESFHIRGARARFTSRLLSLDDLEIDEQKRRLSVKGRIDLGTKRGSLQARIGRWLIGDPPLLALKGLDLPVRLSYGAGKSTVLLPTLKARLVRRANGGWQIVLSDLSLLRPYLLSRALRPDGGTLELNLDPSGAQSFSGLWIWKASPLYRGDSVITRIPFTGYRNQKGWRIGALDGGMTIEGERALVTLSHLGIDLKRLNAWKAATASDWGAFRDAGKRWRVIGIQSPIRYGSHLLRTDRYRLELAKGSARFEGRLGSDSVRIVTSGSVLKVSAERISDRMLGSLIHFGGLKGGRYWIEASGKLGGTIRGVVKIEGGALRDFKAYNDLLAFINTVPALVTLSDPGFSSKGFVIRRGEIAFTLLGQKELDLDSIWLRGRSATVAGKGKVDLESGALAVDLAIHTAREIGKTLGSLPIVGYILFGKDKSVTVGVEIGGTLDRPKVQSHTIRDTLFYPLQLLKRTLTFPAGMAAPVPSLERPPGSAAEPGRPELPSDRNRSDVLRMEHGQSDAF